MLVQLNNFVTKIKVDELGPANLIIATICKKYFLEIHIGLMLVVRQTNGPAILCVSNFLYPF